MARTRLNPGKQLRTQNKDFGKRVSLLYLLFVHSHYLQRFFGALDNILPGL